MRTRWLAVLALALAMLPVLVLARSSADETDKPLSVELSSFSFKVAKEKADLFTYNDGEGKLSFYTNGAAEAKVKVANGGDFELVVTASGDKALKEGAKFKVTLNGKPLGKETETSDGEPKEYKFPATLKAGEHTLSIAFTNDAYKEGEYDRNLYVHSVTLKKVK
jgi:hypothetical protein